MQQRLSNSQVNPLSWMHLRAQSWLPSQLSSKLIFQVKSDVGSVNSFELTSL